jgi:hypothetical protein
MDDGVECRVHWIERKVNSFLRTTLSVHLVTDHVDGVRRLRTAVTIVHPCVIYKCEGPW